MQHKEPDGMTNEPGEERRKKNQREPARESRPSQPEAEPITPPLVTDGPELVRDSHC
jgi:hypothetical protein